MEELSNLLGISTQVDDDIKVLPSAIIPIYKNPYRAFGLDNTVVNSTNYAEHIPVLRDTIRKACISHSNFFAGKSKPKLTLQQLLLAYHLIRGTVDSTSPKAIKEALEKSPHFVNFSPNDLLPLLRPLRPRPGREGSSTANQEFKDYRGCRALAIDSKGFHRVGSINSIYGFKLMFTFSVHYCLRIHTIEVFY